jgi:hypothetical protein
MFPDQIAHAFDGFGLFSGEAEIHARILTPC